jgi:predicted dehydrogenase
MSFVRCILFLMATAIVSAADLRLGIVGTDTSHAIAFTKLLNDPKNPEHVAGARIVAAFKGGSADIPSSASRVEGYAAELAKDWGVAFYASIAELVQNVDAVLILSVDGRPHLAQARQVFPSKKPVFIDKPLAGSLRDALAIAQLGKTTGTRWFTSSSLRWNTLAVLKGANTGELRGASTFGPCELEPHHPDLFWYGVHAVESLYSVMGRGCVSVVRTHGPAADVVTGVWSDGRVGTMRGTRDGKYAFGVTVFGKTGIVTQEVKTGYRGLVEDIVSFFHGGEPPVTNEESLELFAFMEAADESKRRDGAPVKLAEVMATNQPEKYFLVIPWCAWLGFRGVLHPGL